MRRTVDARELHTLANAAFHLAERVQFVPEALVNELLAELKGIDVEAVRKLDDAALNGIVLYADDAAPIERFVNRFAKAVSVGLLISGRTEIKVENEELSRLAIESPGEFGYLMDKMSKGKEDEKMARVYVRFVDIYNISAPRW